MIIGWHYYAGASITSSSCSRTNRRGNGGTENIYKVDFRNFGLSYWCFLFFCTGSVSYALFISLLISKLFCTVQRAVWGGAGEGGGGPLKEVDP